MAIRLTDEQRGIVRRVLTTNCPPGSPWQGRDLGQINDDTLYDWYKRARDGAAVAPVGNVGHTPPVVVAPPPAPRPQTMEEWLAMMPAGEAQEVWNSAVAVHNEEKGRLISQLVANLIDSNERDDAIKHYGAKPIEELRKELKWRGPAQPAQHMQPVANYFGAAAPVTSQLSSNEEPLTSPQYDFGRTGT